MSVKSEQRLDDLGRALSRLEEMLVVPTDTPGRIDATIQRFEFTIELFWKTMKAMLEESERVFPTTPKQVFSNAFTAGWINDEKLWLGMLDDRNRSSHTYREDIANDVMAHILVYVPLMRLTYSELQVKADATD